MAAKSGVQAAYVQRGWVPHLGLYAGIDHFNTAPCGGWAETKDFRFCGLADLLWEEEGWDFLGLAMGGTLAEAEY